jgi:parallel beta-helix repeat protein
VDCTIYGNTLSGVEVKEHGRPVLESCQVYANQQSGVYVHTNGGGRFVDCTIYGNRMRGVDITKGGNPVLEHCRIYESQHSGVWVRDDGKGELHGCQIWSNGANGVKVASGTLRDGVSIGAGGDPLLIRCEIYDSVGAGVWVYEKGLGTLQECDIFRNQATNIDISDGGAPRIIGCTIRDGKEDGIFMRPGAGGHIENCKVSNNAKLEVRIAATSTTVLKGNEIAFYPPGGYDRLRSLLRQKKRTEAATETIQLIRAASGSRCIDSKAKARKLSRDLLHVLEYLWTSSGSGSLKDRRFVHDPSRGVTQRAPWVEWALPWSRQTWLQWQLWQQDLPY